jgi:uncharacterized protein
MKGCGRSAEVVKVGQIVKVRVLEVNEPLKRISLTMKPPAGGAGPQDGRKPVAPKPKSATVRDLMARFNRK